LAKNLKANERFIRNNKEWSDLYIDKETNQLYAEGSLLKNAKLAKTFETIANEGEKAFYNGSLTDKIIEEVKSNGSILQKEDLQNYECLIKEPIKVKIKDGLELNSVPAPSCGVLLNFIISLMDNYDYSKDKYETCIDEKSKFYHRFCEACKLAFGIRFQLGDDKLYSESNKQLYKYLTDPNVIEEFRQKIRDNEIHPLDCYGSSNFVTDNGTSHTSVVAPNGDAVAITSSINLIFGSKVMGEHTGILYNNSMDDFSCPSSECNSFGIPNYEINFCEPNKRPISSMSPLIVLNEDRSLKLVVGASGGTRILTCVALATVKNLKFNYDIAQSVDGCRVHHQLNPDHLLHEHHFDKVFLFC
jgi:gamma-glutamyltranspeptidase / glutathione hydrolase / leukotriene-C4 hydrolase